MLPVAFPFFFGPFIRKLVGHSILAISLDSFNLLESYSFALLVTCRSSDILELKDPETSNVSNSFTNYICPIERKKWHQKTNEKNSSNSDLLFNSNFLLLISNTIPS
ncbi:uncharacterized protein DS421_14g474050 [Arachis hypogaea]|nr:uncharacterized protein DS421_14g474050 [Arachis hypogaea]